MIKLIMVLRQNTLNFFLLDYTIPTALSDIYMASNFSSTFNYTNTFSLLQILVSFVINPEGIVYGVILAFLYLLIDGF